MAEHELLKEQNTLLKGILVSMIEMLPRHRCTCYGLQVHPGNRESCCSCDMAEIRQRVSELLPKQEAGKAGG